MSFISNSAPSDHPGIFNWSDSKIDETDETGETGENGETNETDETGESNKIGGGGQYILPYF